MVLHDQIWQCIFMYIVSSILTRFPTPPAEMLKLGQNLYCDLQMAIDTYCTPLPTSSEHTDLN